MPPPSSLKQEQFISQEILKKRPSLRGLPIANHDDEDHASPKKSLRNRKSIVTIPQQSSFNPEDSELLTVPEEEVTVEPSNDLDASLYAPVYETLKPPAAAAEHQRPASIMQHYKLGAIANLMEGDEEEDDALSVILEASAEDSAEQQHQSESQEADIRSWSFWKRWIFRGLTTLFIMGVVMVPGVVCKAQLISQCQVIDTSLWYYSLFLASAVFSHFLGKAAVVLVMIIIKRTPFLGTQFLYYITNISKPLQLAVTAVLIQVAWPAVFAKQPLFSSDVGDIINSIIICITVTAVSFLVKALLLRVLAIGFHRGAYYVRIKNSLLAEYVLNTLLMTHREKTSVTRLIMNQTINHLQQYVRGVSVNNQPHLLNGQAQPSLKPITGGDESPKKSDVLRANNKNGFGDAENVDSLIFHTIPVREQELLAGHFSNHKLAVFVEFIKRNTFSFQSDGFKDAVARFYARQLQNDRLEKVESEWKNNQEDEDFVVTIVSSVGQNSDEDDHEAMMRAFQSLEYSQAAKVLAHIIFVQTKQPDRSEVFLDDFKSIMSESLAKTAFALFDGNWDGSLTEREFYTTLLSISRERKALRTALNDGEKAIAKLNSAITGILVLVLFITYFMIFKADPSKVLLTLSSFLLATAFAIGNTAKTLLESVIFIFVTHPFDIGDRVVIDDVIYTVTKMNLLTTALKRFDNAFVYISNSVLSSKPIINLRRSPDQIDVLTIHINFTTPIHLLREFELELANYIEKRSTHFYPKFEVEYKDVENSNRMVIRLRVQHRNNFANMRRFRERRSRLVLKIKKLCEELGIQYDLPPQAAGSMNAVDYVNSLDNFKDNTGRDKKKESFFMHPAPLTNEGALGSL